MAARPVTVQISSGGVRAARMHASHPAGKGVVGEISGHRPAKPPQDQSRVGCQLWPCTDQQEEVLRKAEEEDCDESDDPAQQYHLSRREVVVLFWGRVCCACAVRVQTYWGLLPVAAGELAARFGSRLILRCERLL